MTTTSILHLLKVGMVGKNQKLNEKNSSALCIVSYCIWQAIASEKQGDAGKKQK